MPDFGKYTTVFKKNKYLFVVLAVGIILLMLPKNSSGEKKAEEPKKIEFSLEEYEEKIADVLKECDGVGRVKVALSVSGTAESVYVMEESVNLKQNDNDYTKDSDAKLSVLSVGSGVETPITIRQNYPEFLGATIVCDGAGSSKIRSDIIGAVSALTGLTTDKITIIKMKN